MKTNSRIKSTSTAHRATQSEDFTQGASEQKETNTPSYDSMMRAVEEISQARDFASLRKFYGLVVH